MNRTAASALCLVLLLSAAACSRGEAVPKALRAHLAALQSGRYDAAFRMTQLDDNASFFGPGASLSREHFEAFFKANPLRSYEILEVVRLEQRTIEAPTEKGSARFEVEAKLHYEDDSVVRQHYSIVGEVVPTVEVEPTLVSVRDARGAPDRDVVLVDGVQTKVVTRDDAPFANVFTLLVLPGRHRVSVAGRELEIRTEPLRVLSGSATVADGPGGGKILEIV